MKKVDLLAWDSSFFGRQIGSLHVAAHDDASRLLTAARRDGYQLVYVFTPQPLPTQLLKPYGGQWVDTKLTFEHPLPVFTPVPANAAIRLVLPTDNLPALYQLAYQSGAHSRFRLDERFGLKAFRRFYRQWMDNSLKGEVADAVYGYVFEEKIIGFITVKATPALAAIGLLATHPAHRGQGVGRALLYRAMGHALEKQAPTLKVVTQRANQPACRFYEQMGFSLKEEVQVYHCWL